MKWSGRCIPSFSFCRNALGSSVTSNVIDWYWLAFSFNFVLFSLRRNQRSDRTSLETTSGAPGHLQWDIYSSAVKRLFLWVIEDLTAILPISKALGSVHILYSSPAEFWTERSSSRRRRVWRRSSHSTLRPVLQKTLDLFETLGFLEWLLFRVII